MSETGPQENSKFICQLLTEQLTSIIAINYRKATSKFVASCTKQQWEVHRECSEMTTFDLKMESSHGRNEILSLHCLKHHSEPSGCHRKTHSMLYLSYWGGGWNFIFPKRQVQGTILLIRSCWKKTNTCSYVNGSGVIKFLIITEFVGFTSFTGSASQNQQWTVSFWAIGNIL